MSINIRWLPATGKWIKINALENGGFETGDLTGWTYDFAAVSTVDPYQGTYSCTVGTPASGEYKIYQAVSYPSDLVSEVYCYASWLNTQARLRITYSDASYDEVALGGADGWTKYSIVPDAGKTITEIRVRNPNTGMNIRVDNITVVCQNRISFAAADGKLTQDSDFPTTLAKNVFINASNKLYQSDRESY